MSSTSAWVALGSGLLLLFLLHACQLPSDAVLRGTVVGVHDGDTLTLLTADRRQVKIRLAGIDAPERRQPYGQRSRQQLADLVSGREVQAQVAGVDKYQRTVARVHVK
ncbi:MAG: thermonuclease family protein, partial [Rubrivivax sp.]|nr:thermonuclease family protein [Rubrivivax sp.]